MSRLTYVLKRTFTPEEILYQCRQRAQMATESIEKARKTLREEEPVLR